MSDEIKEYLDTLKEIVGEGKSKGTYGISYWHWKEILDYITNLQQRIEYLERSNNRREENITSLQDECTELEQENEYLKKHQRFHKKFGNDYIFCVEGDKETYKDLLLEKQEELEDYKSRVEKAIEAINTQLKNAEGGYKDNLRIIKFNLIKGSCTFEDLKTEDDYKYSGGKDGRY